MEWDDLLRDLTRVGDDACRLERLGRRWVCKRRLNFGWEDGWRMGELESVLKLSE